MALFVTLFIATCFLAYSNGANDNFKGVATLFGSKTTSYKTAIWWATATTLAGSISSIFLAQGLVKNFSGKGLVPDGVIASPNFLLSVALAGGLTVMLATLTGFPISTTHALTGALVGAGIMAVGTQVNFAKLGGSHVSVGSLFGVGLISKQNNPKVVSQILLSWVLTLPIAAILGGTVYWLLPA